jgi:hypothetical protein
MHRHCAWHIKVPSRFAPIGQHALLRGDGIVDAPASGHGTTQSIEDRVPAREQRGREENPFAGVQRGVDDAVRKWLGMRYLHRLDVPVLMCLAHQGPAIRARHLAPRAREQRGREETSRAVSASGLPSRPLPGGRRVVEMVEMGRGRHGVAVGHSRMRDSKCQMPDAKCQMRDSKCQMPDAKCQMPDARQEANKSAESPPSTMPVAFLAAFSPFGGVLLRVLR